MQVFTTKGDVEWELELNIGVFEEVNSRYSVDLFDPIEKEDGGSIGKIIPVNTENICRFCDILFVVCEEQCKERSLDRDQFTRLLCGPAIESAYKSFFQEWEDFFQSLGRKETAEGLKKLRELMEKSVDELVKRIREIDSLEQLEKTVEELKEESLPMSSQV